MAASGGVRDIVGHAVHWARARAGYAPLPHGLDLLLTDACNLRCKYCPVAKDTASGRATGSTDTTKAIRFLESVADWRPEIRFFGGEPFLHPEWSRIFSAAVACGLSITVVTNGTRLHGLAEDLVKSGLLAIGISVDPPLAHDASRGDGTFSTCERVVQEIHRARAKLGSRTPSIVIYTTVYEETYTALTRWAEQLRGWKIDMLRLQHRIWVGSARRLASERLIAGAIGDSTFFRSDIDTFCTDAMPNVDPTVLEAQLRALEAGSYGFPIESHPLLSVDEMVAFYRDSDFERQTARACTLISEYAFVDPRGRLYPCLSLDMGNVFERPFERVWNGSRFRGFRRLLRRERRLPLCARCPA